MVDTSTREPTGAEEKAVIDDWYDNGVLDDLHTCAAIRGAIERLPTSATKYSTVRQAMLEFEQRACP